MPDLTQLSLQAKYRGVSSSSIGGNIVGGDWASPYPNSLDDDRDQRSPFPLYPLPPSSSPLLRKQLASTSSSNWVEHLEKLDSRNRLSDLKLEPASTNPINVTRLLWDPLEKVAARQVTRGMMSTWWGQTRVLKRMIERGDESALVLEDDVDLEWDIERMWNTIHRRLPGDNGWDITYLGYCWGGETQSQLLPIVDHKLRADVVLCRASIPASPLTSVDRSDVSPRLRPLAYWREADPFPPLLSLGRLSISRRPRAADLDSLRAH